MPKKKTGAATAPMPHTKNDLRARYMARLIRWAELISAVNVLKERVRLAGRDGVIDETDVHNVGEALDDVRDALVGGVPTE